MKRSYKYKWLKGSMYLALTYDCAFKKPRIKKNEKTLCNKLRRNYMKK